MQDTTLIHGDCLAVMPTLEPSSVDAVIADLPYGSTRCPWDVIIPFDPLWAAIEHVLKPDGVVVLTASGAFSALLTVSKLDWYRYRWVWNKVNRMSGHFNAKRQPLRVTEDILVFSPGPHRYRPQMVQGEPYRSSHGGSGNVYKLSRPIETDCSDGLRYPQDLIAIKADCRGTEGRVHPSQKPTALTDYLLRTYTDPGALILDPTMGSGTAGVSCVRLGRRFIGIERDAKHFGTARARILPAQPAQAALALAA
ncbi:DNA-methyltransferase [Methylobacterium sp. D53M]